MKLLPLFAMAFLFLSACSSTPPTPPEPEGPLNKVNINQPHEIYGGQSK